MEIDPFGYTASLPKCFITPIASKSIDAIKKYVGEVENVDIYKDEAFIVHFQKYDNQNNFDIWNHPRSHLINCEKQLWIEVKSSNYRKAYEIVFPEIEITKKIHIDHLMNRRQAERFGFKFIRLVHVDHEINVSSGAGAEKLAMREQKDLNATIDYFNNQQIEYADIFVLSKFLNLNLGGRPFLDIRELNSVFYDGELLINFHRNRLINLLKYISGFDKLYKLPKIKNYTKKQLLEFKERISFIENEIAILNNKNK